MILYTYFIASAIFLLFTVIFLKVITTINAEEKTFIIETLTSSISSFQNNKRKTIFFIGDSIINNKNYIADVNKSVPELLKQEFKDENVVILAQDNATIESVYFQLDEIDTSDYKNTKCIFCISVGGNDMLEMIWSFSMNEQDVEFLFKRYILLIKKIKILFPKSKIYLLTLYYPTETLYKKYYDYIEFWNKLLEKNKVVYGYDVVNIDKYINDETDFTYSIEPSELGGQKITQALKQNIKI